MFNRLNLLSIFNVATILLIWVALFIDYGFSEDADYYFLSIAIVGSLFLLQQLFFDQYQVFQSEIQCEIAATNFFHASVTFSVVVAIFSFVLIKSTAEYWITIFISTEFDRVSLLYTLDIVFWLLIIYPVFFIIDKYLNYKKFYSISYVALIVGNIFLLLNIIFGQKDITAVAYAKVFSSVISFLVLLIFIAYLRDFPSFSLNKLIPQMIKNSIKLRFAHNIHNFLMTPITTYFLTMFPSGSSSLFFYAQKAALVVKEVVIGPHYKVYMSNVFRVGIEMKYAEVNEHGNDFIKNTLNLLIILSLIIALGMYLFLPILNSEITHKQLLLILLIYSFHVLWLIIMTLELKFIPHALIKKNATVFYFGNVLFIIIFSFLTFTMSNYLGLISICLSLIIAQVNNLIIYRGYVLRGLNGN